LTGEEDRRRRKDQKTTVPPGGGKGRRPDTPWEKNHPDAAETRKAQEKTELKLKQATRKQGGWEKRESRSESGSNICDTGGKTGGQEGSGGVRRTKTKNAAYRKKKEPQ